MANWTYLMQQRFIIFAETLTFIFIIILFIIISFCVISYNLFHKTLKSMCSCNIFFLTVARRTRWQSYARKPGTPCIWNIQSVMYLCLTCNTFYLVYNLFLFFFFFHQNSTFQIAFSETWIYLKIHRLIVIISNCKNMFNRSMLTC